MPDPAMNKNKVSPLLIVVLSFLGIIAVGSILLALPISGQNGRIAFVDAMFLSFSAVCVTGLSPFANLGATLSVFGKVVLAALVQIGGLGIVTIAIYILMLLGVRIGVTERFVVREALNQSSLQGMVKLVKSIIVTALAFETIGLILNFIVFIQDYPFWQALGISAFHTVSSFNNAGFDIIGSTSFMAYANDPLFNFTTTMLIICGGIGFIVIHDILVKRNWKNLTNYTKIVLKTTAVLLVGGTLYLKAVEGSDISWFQAFFQSVTPRTAGFYTADLTAFAIPSIAGLVLLMFIGASPNSTGGGIKTTTAYTMFKSTISFLRGKTPVLKNRKIDDETRIKAFTITFLSAVVIFAAFVAVTAIERDSTAFEPTGTNILFEIVSAIGTVGLSLNVTPFLTPASKIVVSIIMFVGRLGPITIFGMWNRNWGHPYASTVDYAAEKILIG